MSGFGLNWKPAKKASILNGGRVPQKQVQDRVCLLWQQLRQPTNLQRRCDSIGQWTGSWFSLASFFTILHIILFIYNHLSIKRILYGLRAPPLCCFVHFWCILFCITGAQRKEALVFYDDTWWWICCFCERTLFIVCGLSLSFFW